MNTTVFEHGDLRAFAELLIRSGYRVFACPTCPTGNKTWFIFEKNGHIAYAQRDDYAAVHLSTIHKPCRAHGSGFRITEESIIPTIADAAAAFVAVPSQFSGARVEKYKSFDEYAHSSPLPYEEVYAAGDL